MESFIWTNHTQTSLKEKFIWVLTTAVFILFFYFWKSNLTSHKALIPWRHTWAKFSIMLASNLIQQLHWSFRKENMTNTWFSRQKKIEFARKKRTLSQSNTLKGLLLLFYQVTYLHCLGALRPKNSLDGDVTTFCEKYCSLRCSHMKEGSSDKIIATSAPKGGGVSWRHIKVSSAAGSHIIFHFIVCVMIFREVPLRKDSLSQDWIPVRSSMPCLFCKTVHCTVIPIEVRLMQTVDSSGW